MEYHFKKGKIEKRYVQYIYNQATRCRVGFFTGLRINEPATDQDTNPAYQIAKTPNSKLLQNNNININNDPRIGTRAYT